MSTISEKLDMLITHLRQRGVTAVDYLDEGLSRAEIDEWTAELPFQLPEEIYQLYQWRIGFDESLVDVSPTDEMVDPPFLFRDQCLLRLDEAIEQYDYILECYDQGSSLEDYGVDLRHCFPFAEFEGSWYAIACGQHQFTDQSQHPIFQIFEGIDRVFYSFDSVLDTCIEWVQQPTYSQFRTPDNEMEIWEKHNPGIFDFG